MNKELKEQAREDYKKLIVFSAIEISPHGVLKIADFIDSIIDKTVQMTEERIVSMMEIEFPPVQQGEFIPEPEKTFNEIRTKLISLITNKSDSNTK